MLPPLEVRSVPSGADCVAVPVGAVSFGVLCPDVVAVESISVEPASEISPPVAVKSVWSAEFVSIGVPVGVVSTGVLPSCVVEGSGCSVWLVD